MNNNRRRPFRGRTKNNFRRRNGGSHPSQSNQFSPGSNGNLNFARNVKSLGRGKSNTKISTTSQRRSK